MSSFTEKLRRLAEPAYYRCYLIPRVRLNQRKLLRIIRKRGEVKVTFLVASLPMWRFQSVFDRLRKDERFKLTVAILPFTNYSDSQREASVQELSTHFNSIGASVIDLSKTGHPGKLLREQVNPDVIFYPQPYNHLYKNDMDSEFFTDKLLCYIPYMMVTMEDPWTFRSFYCNIAWRVFVGDEITYANAKSMLFDGGKNIRVAGEPMADVFAAEDYQDVWKPQPCKKKRVIWAPHFSFVQNDQLNRDSFSWLHQEMLDIARQYQDNIQFAFKPHPRLFTELCNHPLWGKEKADEYYNRWRDGANTQLETGPFVALFKGSDAMIHDSGSFTAEYQFTGKPAMFTTRDMTESEKTLNALGKAALQVHYPGKCREDIITFLESVVLKGEDPMQAVRQDFKEKFLTSPGGKSTADNIHREVVSSIFG